MQLKRWLSGLFAPELDTVAVAQTRSVVGAAAVHRPRKFLAARMNRAFGYSVLLPTLLTAAYYFCIAADQYESEAHFFIVSEGASEAPSSSGSGPIMSSSSTTASASATLAVVDYLKSHDALRDMRQSVDVAAVYQRPEADWLARFWGNPSPERLYSYLFGERGLISAYLDISGGVAVLKVRAFRPDDAQNVAKALLAGADHLVDRFGQRIQEDTVRVASGEVERAETRVAASQDKVTAFRLRDQSVDPSKSAQTVLEVVGKLEDQLSQAEADLVAAQTYLQPGSPRYNALNNRVEALKSQITSERSRLTGTGDSLTPALAEYSRLMLEQDFAQKDYQAALAGLEMARIQADRQHMYLVQVVEPNLPQDAEFPRSWYNVFTVFVTLSVCYGIGWLIVAGVREHAG